MTSALVNGRACDADEAVAAAAGLLRAARLPLVWGLVDSTVEAQLEAVRIAEILGGPVDSASSGGRAGWIAAFEQVGGLTCTLGELRRAQLVAFWASDPEARHPGFLARYLPDRPGPGLLSIDADGAHGPASIGERVSLPASRELECLLVLRAFVRGRRVEAPAAGLPLDALRGLAARLTGSGQGVIVYDAEPPLSRRDPERDLGLAALVRDARTKARLRLLGLPGRGNAVGAENVLAWRTGFPAAVSFAGREPRYAPVAFSGEGLLERGDVDAALVVGTRPEEHLGPRARSHLARIPTVRLGAAAGEPASIFIATADLDDTTGTVFRIDGVALRHPARGRSPLPTEAAVLSRIAGALGDGTRSA
jgi:formylmethanofuran dehydrogenase subunit B